MDDVTAKTSGEIASFMTPAKTNIKSLKVHFSPKQLGTGDPSPENVREIEGWDGVEVNGCEKNLFDNNNVIRRDKYLLNDNGIETSTSISGYTLSLTKITPNTTYTLKGSFSTKPSSYWRVYFYSKDKEFISRTDTLDVNNIPYTFESSSDCYYIAIQYQLNCIDFSTVQLELGSVSSSYEPYQGNNILTDWSSDVGTVYGGYVDLISGELVEEYGCVKLEDLNWTAKDNRTRTDDLSSSILPPSYSVMVNIIGEQVQPASYSMNLTNYPNAIACSSNGQLIKYYDSENPQGLMAYQLKTPITHQLTPIQLKSFVGRNNFWSNADYVEVEYDLIETIDIQKAKRKIMLNQPQLKTVSNKVVSFNTDMIAPMKNCKIYFKPIQLGTGDASITNFRDIKGWTSIDTYVNGDKINVDWTSEAGTRYGGYVDLVKGELVIDWIYFIFGRSSKVSDYGTSADGLRKWMTLRITHNAPPYQITPDNGDDYGMFSIGNWRHSVETGKNRAYVNSTYVYAIITTDIEDLTTAEGRTAFFDRLETNNIPIEVVYKRATPLRYQLTPQQLLTFKGENNIWSETNGQQIDVKYWTRKNLTSTSLINYLENQTWTDNAYISSSGKKSTNAVLPSPSHYLTNQILLEAGTYVLSGFSYYVGSDTTNYRIHAYDSTGKWLRQITFQQIDNLSPVDISFTLDTDTYVNVSIAMDFDGVLAKIS